MATVLDGGDYSNVQWMPYNSNVVVNLGSVEGWHTVSVGLKGLPPNAPQTWNSIQLNLLLTPPALVVTNPVEGTIAQPFIQIQGYSPENLAGLSYDLDNGAGFVTNQQALITTRDFDTNDFEYSTNGFECFNVPMADGVNIVMLHATDSAGNASTSYLVYNFDPAANTNAPTVNISWPPDNASISGNSFPIRGVISDPFASVSAQIVNDGATNYVSGLVEQNGAFWIENVPLGVGENDVTIFATNTAGYGISTNIVVNESETSLTIDSVSFNDPTSPTANVTCSLAGSGTVFANGVEATNNGDGTWTAYYVSVGEGGTASITAGVSSESGSDGEFEDDASGAWSDTQVAEDVVRNAEFIVTDYRVNWGAIWTDGPFGDGNYNQIYNWKYDSPGNWSYGACSYQGRPAQLEYEYEYENWDATGNGVLFETTSTNCGEIGPVGYSSVANAAAVGCPGGAAEIDLQASGVEFTQGFSYPYQYQGQYLTRYQVAMETRGQSVAGQQNLWALNAGAITSVPGYYAGEVASGTLIPPNQLTVAGQQADTDGNVYLSLPNNAPPINVTVSAPSSAYTFGGGITEYQAQIQANGITLSPTAVNATFCVGQRVQFTLVLSSVFTYGTAVPLRYTNQVCTWTPPSKFVNAVILNPPASPVYTNLSSLLVTTNSPCPCWFVNGTGGTVSVQANIMLSDGKTIPVSAVGQIGIERPVVSLPTSEIGRPRFFSITTNFFGGATVKLGTPGKEADGEMFYTPQCMTEFDGLGMITQTCQLSYNPDSGGFNFTDWRLDGSTNYTGPTNITAQPVPVDFPTLDDGPDNGTRLPTSSIEVKGNFIDYVRFNPNTSGSIYVTLGTVTWNIDGLITNTGSGWALIISNTPDPVFNSSDQFPFYTQPR